MTDQEILHSLVQKLDENQHVYAQLNKEYAGEGPLAFLSPESKKLLGSRLDKLFVRLPRLTVDKIAERLRVTGFSGATVWADWTRCDLDQMSGLLHTEALTLGHAYAIVWADTQGRPTVSVESAQQVLTVHDPGSRRVLRAIKKWETKTTTEAVVYEPDRIIRWRANHLGAVTGFTKVETLANPLGWVPVVRFCNTSRLLGEGESEMGSVTDLTSAVNKLVVDMLTGSESSARPRRWATGLELEEVPELDDDGEETGEMVAVGPPEGDKFLVNEEADGKFGQLPGHDLAGYTEAIGQVMRLVSAVSGLPDHMLGIGGDNPSSADAIRASEAGLTARAESRQGIFGRQWEQVARLIVAVRDSVDPETVAPSIGWADPSTRSVAQEADAVVKLFTAGLLPQKYALARLGYDADEIEKITNEGTTTNA